MSAGADRCARCDGLGWIRVADGGVGAAIACDCRTPTPNRTELEARSRRARRSRRKGIEGERELSAWFRERGVPARRGVQRQGGPDSPDVEAAVPFHIECKRQERLSILAALAQARGDAAGRGAVALQPFRLDRDSHRRRSARAARPRSARRVAPRGLCRRRP